MKCLEAPPESIKTDSRTYNIQAVSFTPGELVEEMKKHIPNFEVEYRPDERQEIGGWSLAEGLSSRWEWLSNGWVKLSSKWERLSSGWVKLSSGWDSVGGA